MIKYDKYGVIIIVVVRSTGKCPEIYLGYFERDAA